MGEYAEMAESYNCLVKQVKPAIDAGFMNLWRRDRDSLPYNA
jgi:hypothetical protein